MLLLLPAPPWFLTDGTTQNIIKIKKKILPVSVKRGFDLASPLSLQNNNRSAFTMLIRFSDKEQ